MKFLVHIIHSPLMRIATLIIGCMGVGCLCNAEAVKPIKVVATFSIAGDLVKQIGGTTLELESLVGANSDGHLYQPSPHDSIKLAKADLVFANGLGFEGWIDRLIIASGFKGKLIRLSDPIQPLYWDKTPDPHAWQSILNAQLYIDVIVQALIQHAPQYKEYYQQQATHYKSALAVLQQEFNQFCASLSDGERRLVTSHDAFSYFGRDCNLHFLAPQGLSTDDEPGAQEIANLIKQIKQEHIPAVFIENMTNPKLIEQIQKETGAVFGGKLYSDALSEANGPADSYLAMMRYNLRTLKSALLQAKTRPLIKTQ
jgi:zinc/manganese transport system substrate-binding protein